MWFDAVPALLAALDDDAFTRVTEVERGRFANSFRARRVSDAAWGVLEDVSWRTLDEDERASPPTSRRALAEAWWARVRDRGEIALATPVVAAGGFGASRLAGLAPDERAVAAIRKGFESHLVGYARREAFHALATIHNPEAAQLLHTFSLPASYFSDRVDAGLALVARGDPDGWTVLCDTWARRRQEIREYRASGHWMGLSFTDEDRDLLDAFVTSGRAEAYRTLAAATDQSGPGDRLVLVLSFLPSTVDLGDGYRRILGYARTRMKGPPLPLAPDAVDVVEDLLGARLADEATLDERYFGEGGPPSVDMHVGRCAAWALAYLFPGRYAYVPSAPVEDREHARLSALASWSARHAEKLKTPR